MSILAELRQTGMKKVPALKPGQTVHVHQQIQEGDKKRIQIFEGLIIKINSGHGVDQSFTVRKIVEGIGVEKTFPVHSPLIKKIVVKKEAKVRRAKLYYMRERFGKSARLKESFVAEVKEVPEEEIKEEVEQTTNQEENVEAKPETTEETPAEEVKAEAQPEEAPTAEAEATTQEPSPNEEEAEKKE
jgi:large subunit ribosomal protein L19